MKVEKESKKLSALLKRKPLGSGKAKKLEKDLCGNEFDLDAALKKSQENMEKKSKIYEKMLLDPTICSNELSDQYLVNFRLQQLNEKAQMKRTLESSLSDIKNIKNYFNQVSERNVHKAIDEIDTSKFENKKMVSKQTRELVDTINAKSNAKLEDVLKVPENKHYQHFKEGDVVDHGVGYFEFSKDETKRQQQLDYLKQLREETKSKRNE